LSKEAEPLNRRSGGSSPRLRLLTVLLTLSLVLGSFLSPAYSQERVTKERAGAKVRLVVGIVIDQFRYDYLTRFEDLFGEGGFRRLLRDGAVFTNANYIYSPTVTAPGHATFMTGSIPALDGIVGNEWFDRAKGKEVTSVADESVRLLGGQAASPGSPSKLIGSTVGDQLRLTNNGRTKIVGLALKDRSAILPAGHRPNGAYWFDSGVGAFVSSTYYFADLPEWVKRFNQSVRPEKYFGAKWDRLLPASAYDRSLPDDSPYEKSKFGNKFPHIINGGESKPGKLFLDQWDESPFANDYTAAFAKAAIDGERLGADDDTDLLTISFSANDGLGHSFGPYSQEVEDMTLRTDRTLADLFDYIDKKVGLTNTVIVLTADHGVALVPEHARDLRLGGGRIDSKNIKSVIEAALNRRFGTEPWVLSAVNGNVYFDYKAIERRHGDQAEAERIGCNAALTVEGIGECFTRGQFLSGQLTPGLLSSHAANGFYPERSGDLVIITKPFYIQRTEAGTSHATPYSYDTHVPVIFYGAGVAPGRYFSACSPADIAATLSAMLKIEPPSNNVGRILTEAIKTSIRRN